MFMEKLIQGKGMRERLHKSRLFMGATTKLRWRNAALRGHWGDLDFFEQK
jgi:hypothetical protein